MADPVSTIDVNVANRPNAKKVVSDPSCMLHDTAGAADVDLAAGAGASATAPYHTMPRDENVGLHLSISE